jgi:hypothetical protein
MTILCHGTAAWTLFWHQFETIAKHNGCMRQEKSPHLIIALQGPTTDVLHGIPKGATYEVLQTLEDRFGDQHFAITYRSQLKVKTQRVGESLRDFATMIEQLVHRASPTLPEDYKRREAFINGVGDHDIEIRLLLGGEKTLIEALQQALELHAVSIATMSLRNNNRASQGTRSPPTQRRDRR